MAHAVGRKQQPAGHQKCKADEKRIGIEGFDRVLHEHRQHQRQRRQQDEQDHPPLERIGLLSAPQLFQMHHRKPFRRQPRDLLPVGNENRAQRAQMQQHVKKQMLLHGAKPQKALQYRQMAGAGDWKKFRNSLHQSQ